MQVPAVLLPLILRLDDINQQPPKDDDVVAGWMGFLIFVLLLVAVALIGWSLSRQFKKLKAAKEAGVFGEDEPDDETTTESPTEGTSEEQTKS